MFFFLDDTGIFQDNNARIHQAGIVKEGFRVMRHHFSQTDRLKRPDLNPIQDLWDVMEKTLNGCLYLLSSIQDFGKKLM